MGNVLVSKHLELIADQAESIARKALEIEKYGNEDTEGIRNLTKLASNVIQDAVDCFFTEDIEKANNVLETRNIIDTEERKFSSTIPNSLAIVQGLAIISEKAAGIA